MAETEKHWAIGELADLAGITVRTLHHYDRLGLLVPSKRSNAKHRRYAADDVRRLYRILTLRQLGFSLEQVASVLDSDANPRSLREAMRCQLERVERQLRELQTLRGRLARILEGVAHSAEPSTQQLFEALEVMTMTVKLNRVYTREGDAGETHLGDMSRVPKTDPSIEVLGDIDELNAQLGAALATRDVPDRYRAWLRRIQNDLFDLGAELSVPSHFGDQRVHPRVTPDYVLWLETICDEVNAKLEPLDSFVLPAGTACAAQLHVCRTVCRRAERRALLANPTNPEIIRYLNRLSDLLFVLSRGVSPGAEPLWEPGSHSQST
jgi:cob(I)alamin adenosyltransferase